ncbi:DUF559 domain-containing protein [Candidatus Saccharibacteria bacterium]|nr:DUF559 domain-containing protein [Candidatus Saccharibacteria bacterium]
MKAKVPDSDIILYASTCKSMREGAIKCGLEASSFYRRAKKLGVYDGDRWKNECISKAKQKADELNKPLVCPHCGKECVNRMSFAGHVRTCPSNPNRNYVNHSVGHKPWNAGLTKESDERLRQKSERIRERYKNNELVPSWSGRKHTEESKQRISESMKLAQKEGRAHNIGECRWNNEHSWPEKWLIQVLKNECGFDEGKQYKTEYPFHRFSLDFAFIEQKLCIEVDGKQHSYDNAQQERDRQKDELLKAEGWLELRIPWIECYNNTSIWIDKIKEFVSRV